MGKRGRPRHPDVLTPREWEVLGLVRGGLSNDAIAERLGISLDGVKYHVSEILGKLGVDNRTDAARWVEEPSRPRAWSGALAPLAFLQRVHFGWLSGAAAAGAAAAIVAALTVLIWALASSDGDSGAPPAGAPGVDKIAYIGTDRNVWALESGGPARRLTDGGTASSPIWSPNGERLLYLQTNPAPSRWQILDLASGGVTGVSVNEGVADGFGEALWSPDSERVALLAAVGGHSGASGGLWIAGLDGVARELVPQAFGVSDFFWSPDGTQIAFSRYLNPEFGPEPTPSTTGKTEPDIRVSPDATIWVVDVSGGTPRRVISRDDLFAALPAQYQDPSFGVTGVGGIQWSPDGEWLSFYTVWLAASAHADGVPLFTVRADGTDLAYHGIVLASPALREWSPDGTTLAITLGPGRDLTAGKTIALVTPGETGARVVAEEPARQPTPLGNGELVSARSDAAPARSPDGTSIAFQASEAGILGAILDVGKIEGPREGIWTAEADGSNARQLTSDPTYLDFAPHWSSDSEWVFFVRTDGQPFAGNAAPSPNAELWKVRADGSEPQRGVDNVLRISSYYGLFEWDNELAWWSGGR